MLRSSKKRKQSPANEPEHALPHRQLEMEMLSDEEGNQDSSDDDGQVDEFPELDTRSDSEESDDDLSAEDDEADEQESTDDGLSDSDSEAPEIFPKAKTLISDVTGQPKRVYPDIEPDYDSDSSTEDVSHIYILSYTLTR
jgi:ribosome biogenesis protein ERB1